MDSRGNNRSRINAKLVKCKVNKTQPGSHQGPHIGTKCWCNMVKFDLKKRQPCYDWTLLITAYIVNSCLNVVVVFILLLFFLFFVIDLVQKVNNVLLNGWHFIHVTLLWHTWGAHTSTRLHLDPPEVPGFCQYWSNLIWCSAECTETQTLQYHTTFTATAIQSTF